MSLRSDTERSTDHLTPYVIPAQDVTLEPLSGISSEEQDRINKATASIIAGIDKKVSEMLSPQAQGHIARLPTLPLFVGSVKKCPPGAVSKAVCFHS